MPFKKLSMWIFTLMCGAVHVGAVRVWKKKMMWERCGADIFLIVRRGGAVRKTKNKKSCSLIIHKSTYF